MAITEIRRSSMFSSLVRCLPYVWVGVLLLGLSLYPMLAWVYGDRRVADALLSDGGAIVITPPHSNTSVRAGERLELPLKVTNATWQTVTLWGARTDCSCATVTNLPHRLGMGQSVSLTLMVQTREDEADSTVVRAVEIYTDYAAQPSHDLEISFQAVP